MSWTATGECVDGEVSVSTDGQTWTSETTAQIRAASLAAQDIVKSGALGDPDATYTVSLSGHANREHEPVAGWANDFVYITVTQKARNLGEIT